MLTKEEQKEIVSNGIAAATASTITPAHVNTILCSLDRLNYHLNEARTKNAHKVEPHMEWGMTCRH